MTVIPDPFPWEPGVAAASAIRALDRGQDLSDYFETWDGTEFPLTYYETVEATGIDPLNNREETG